MWRYAGKLEGEEEGGLTLFYKIASFDGGQMNIFDIARILMIY